jgi:hypothetical protein
MLVLKHGCCPGEAAAAATTLLQARVHSRTPRQAGVNWTARQEKPEVSQELQEGTGTRLALPNMLATILNFNLASIKAVLVLNINGLGSTLGLVQTHYVGVCRVFARQHLMLVN